ncbi:hypothetical protein KAR91_88040 [Candidatus Pacearchaeota archaeon]|nr:hypothetical protein [Candidatus Pacearchaeota archaeon]
MSELAEVVVLLKDIKNELKALNDNIISAKNVSSTAITPKDILDKMNLPLELKKQVEQIFGG